MEGVEQFTHSSIMVISLSYSMSLYLGSEIFDIHCQPLQREYSHLFVRQGERERESEVVDGFILIQVLVCRVRLYLRTRSVSGHIQLTAKLIAR